MSEPTDWVDELDGGIEGSARCEDYPACGHNDGLPCNWKAPDYRDPAVAAAHHIGCDHNTGYCEYEEDDDDELEYDEDSEYDADPDWEPEPEPGWDFNEY